MKKLIEFVKGLGFIEWVAIGMVTAVSIALVVSVISRTDTAINEHKISKLEFEKQQILKERDEARARDLILQGQVFAKDEQIKVLTSQLADSTQKVSNAHNETQSARSNLNKVRGDAPKFNSSDDAGRVAEFSAAVRELYRDSPR